MMKMTMTMMNNGVWHKISTQWINPLPSCVLFLRQSNELNIVHVGRTWNIDMYINDLTQDYYVHKFGHLEILLVRKICIA